MERKLTAEYIERDKAIEAVRSDPMGGLNYKRILTDIPAADVAPVVHAYWRDAGSVQECSACKEIQYGYDTGRHYCANCGAKMDGERKENCNEVD